MRIDIPGKGLIEFEGQTLSDPAKYFEITPGYHDFPSESKRWILDLHYAWARGRSAESGLILRTCELIETASIQEQSALNDRIQKGFPKLQADTFLHYWFEALAIIRKIASQKEVCYWIIRPEPGEADEVLKTSIKIIKLNASFAKMPKQFKQHLEEILTAPEAEKIRFILDFTDGYSDPK